MEGGREEVKDGRKSEGRKGEWEGGKGLCLS